MKASFYVVLSAGPCGGSKDVCQRGLSLATVACEPVYYELRAAANGGTQRVALERRGESLKEQIEQRLVDPHASDYLTSVQQHANEVKAAPAAWLPWYFRNSIASLAASS